MVIDERQFRFAHDAKASIDRQGYYLMGASVTLEDAFGADAAEKPFAA